MVTAKAIRPLGGNRKTTDLGNKPGILVVDDEPSVRNLLDVVLQRQGFQVWLAADGRSAVQLYQRFARQIAVALLDVRMPGLDGPQTLAALQEINPKIGCCFMSGHTGEYTERELLQLGAVRVFGKPFPLAELGPFLRHLATQAQRRLAGSQRQ